MARHLGWTAVEIISGDDSKTGESSSRWVLITSNGASSQRAGLAHQSSPLEQPRADHLDRRFREPVARAELLDGFVLRVTNRIQFALGALGLARHAQRAAVKMSCSGKSIHFSRGMIFIRSCSILTGSVFLVRSRRCALRWTCVSTTTPAGMLKQAAQHDVGGLSRHAGNGQHLIHGLGHLAAEIRR